MRWPDGKLASIRFTIRRLMVAVFVAGLLAWGLLVILPRWIAERRAKDGYRQAIVAREIAEVAFQEYVEGIYPQDKATVVGQIALAQSDRQRAIDRLEWSGKMMKIGYVSKATHLADKLALQQAVFDIEQAETQLKVLETYTRNKRLKSLQGAVDKARAAEQAKLETYRAERLRRRRSLGL